MIQEFKVITDTAVDLSIEQARDLGVSLVPLTIRFADDEYVDKIELTQSDFEKKLLTASQLPSTAAPSPGTFESQFRAAIQEGYKGVLCLCISSGLSATYQSALSAAELVKDDIKVEVIDTQQATVGQALLVTSAVELSKSGKSLAQAKEQVLKEVQQVQTVGTLESLDHLRRGGRIGAAGAFFGKLLGVKPVIIFKEGKVAPLMRARSRQHALTAIVNKVAELPNVDTVYVGSILAAESDMQRVLGSLKEVLPNASYSQLQIGPVVGTHGGPGTIAISVRFRG